MRHKQVIHSYSYTFAQEGRVEVVVRGQIRKNDLHMKISSWYHGGILVWRLY